MVPKAQKPPERSPQPQVQKIDTLRPGVVNPESKGSETGQKQKFPRLRHCLLLQDGATEMFLGL